MNHTSTSSEGSSSRPGTARHTAEENQAIFDDFESYQFNDDPEFRAGLPTVISAIRSKKPDPGAIDEMIARAQWFFFTRKRNVSIPWDVYALHSQTHHPRSPAQEDPIRTLNNLAEARRMMLPSGASVGGAGASASGSTGGSGGGRGSLEGEQGMTFDMLCKLISEGRAEEVKGRDIPEGLNETPPSQAAMPSRPKPWQTHANAAPQSLTLTSELHPSPAPYHSGSYGPSGSGSGSRSGSGSTFPSSSGSGRGSGSRTGSGSGGSGNGGGSTNSHGNLPYAHTYTHAQTHPAPPPSAAQERTVFSPAYGGPNGGAMVVDMDVGMGMGMGMGLGMDIDLDREMEILLSGGGGGAGSGAAGGAGGGVGGAGRAGGAGGVQGSRGDEEGIGGQHGMGWY
ncbi:hypothetical protein IAT38_008237 [Cryptococcus sp. DSM 104549]